MTAESLSCQAPSSQMVGTPAPWVEGCLGVCAVAVMRDNVLRWTRQRVVWPRPTLDRRPAAARPGARRTAEAVGTERDLAGCERGGIEVADVRGHAGGQRQVEHLVEVA